MNQLEYELELIEKEARELRSNYRDSENAAAYLDLLTGRVEELREEQRRISEFIASIPDERVKEIACYRLFEGLTYQEIGGLMHYSPRYVRLLWRPYKDWFYGKESASKR